MDFRKEAWIGGIRGLSKQAWCIIYIYAVALIDLFIRGTGVSFVEDFSCSVIKHLLPSAKGPVSKQAPRALFTIGLLLRKSSKDEFIWRDKPSPSTLVLAGILSGVKESELPSAFTAIYVIHYSTV